MKIETFFENFDQLAESPNAVAKIRELVLELAVRGKLSEQNHDDHADSVWRQLAEQLLVNNPSNPPEIDPPFDIPKSWRWVTLNNVGETKPRNNALDQTQCSFVPMTLIPAEYGRRVALHQERTWRDVKKGYTHFKNGDIVIAKITPCFENGKSAIMDRLTGGIGAGTTELHVFRRASDAVQTRFVLIYLKSRGFIDRGIPRMTGSAGQKRVPHDYFSNSPVPLPPPAEQKRIVAKVDELMALCDRLEAQLQEREARHEALARVALTRFTEAPTPSNLNLLFHKSFTIEPTDLRKTILTLAVQGKLVPQESNDEPASELFCRIQSEQAQKLAEGIYRNSMSLPPIGEQERPFPLPCGWQWFRLRTLVFTLGDGLHGTPEYSEGTDCYFINGNNLVNGRIVIKPHTKTVSFEEMQKHRKQMTSNTILVSINGTLGSVAFYEGENVVLGKSACYFNLSNLVDKHFVRLVIESPYFVSYAIENATGTTIRNLGLRAMKYFPVPLPPLAEQRRIVAKVDQLMALVDLLEAQLAASRSTATSLMNAIVAELTSKD